ncbi:hypothetical protein AVEN_120894-1 [Araneus ventricosus]|uniref:Integrase zinc-binding domain-containing protein n=1 Tax=Araneus ventricosus TaxID=182803 RepID=A0A4Y2JGA4_ARAVE|nr:hypothetical protein AVEN_120894-1 [Araneus ventricosus]
MNSSFWIHGPECLRQKEENWPKGSDCKFSPGESGERRIIQDQISTFLCEARSNSAPLLDMSKHSCLNKLLRVTSWVFCFIHNIRNDVKRYGVISAEELLGAEKYWRKTTQGDVFVEEIAHLKQGKRVSKTSAILELNPFLDSDGIIQAGGRLQKSKFTYLQKHPILMPAKHHFVSLLVFDSHKKVFHFGISDTLMEIREKYWVIKERQTVKNHLKRCVMCNRFNSSPGVQVTASLSIARME